MNLSFTRGDDKAAVEENYRRLAKALEVDYEKFVFTDQTHTVNVRKVTGADAGKGLTKDRDYQDVDGLITNEPGLVLSTFFADCVPLYFIDPVHRAIGMSHSGWRGTVARMGKVTLEAMQREYGTNPADVICAIGPSIGSPNGNSRYWRKAFRKPKNTIRLICSIKKKVYFDSTSIS